jgi:hypothetical protein
MAASGRRVMKGYLAWIWTWVPLAAYLALPRCDVVARPDIDSSVTFRLTSSFGTVLHAGPPSTDESTPTVLGSATVYWQPSDTAPEDLALAWTLTVEPAEAGTLGRNSGRDTSNGRNPFVLDFSSVFVPSATYRGPVTIRGTVRVEDVPTNRPLAAQAIAQFEMTDGPADAGGDQLQVSCQRNPDHGPAPLSVAFGATPAGCVGACHVRWDFGDGEVSYDLRPTHVYRTAGEYDAYVTVSDDPSGVARCRRAVAVSEPPSSDPGPTPSPSASPTAPGNRPPEIRDISLTGLTDPLTRRLRASVFDPDLADTVTWDLTLLAGPSGASLTPASDAGGMLSSVFTATSAGTYAVRIHAVDNHGAQATTSLGVTVP